jgi:hypothetical protein
MTLFLTLDSNVAFFISIWYNKILKNTSANTFYFCYLLLIIKNVFQQVSVSMVRTTLGPKKEVTKAGENSVSNSFIVCIP